MKLGVQSDNLLEGLAMRLGVVPSGLMEAWLGPVIGRTWIAAVRLGLIETLADGPLDSETVASRCATGAQGTKALLDAMAGLGAIRRRDGLYGLTPETRKWFLRSSDKNVADFVDFLGVQWSWLDHLEEYVRSDKPLDIHKTMSEAEWDAYQRGMRAAANFLAPEVAKRMPMPTGAKSMLDIGGSHGFYSVMLCRRYADLRAVVLDLPEAVAAAAPILAREKMGERVVHRAGNALDDELGESEHDAILISDLAHHFDDSNNRALVQKCAGALRPGGMLVIKDTVRAEENATPKQMPQLGALGVSMISDSTMWTVPQMVAWLEEADLQQRKTVWLRGAPGVGMIVGQRPS